jgi:hypothetical protein
VPKAFYAALAATPSTAISRPKTPFGQLSMHLGLDALRHDATAIVLQLRDKRGGTTYSLPVISASNPGTELLAPGPD